MIKVGVVMELGIDSKIKQPNRGIIKIALKLKIQEKRITGIEEGN